MRISLIVFFSFFLLFSACKNSAEPEAWPTLKDQEKAGLKKKNELLKQKNQMEKAPDSSVEEKKMTEVLNPLSTESKQFEQSEPSDKASDEWTAPAEHGEVDHLYVRKGEHNFTLQWLGKGKPGAVTIDYLGEGDYSIKGEQHAKDGYVMIYGTFSTVSKKELRFTGQIVTEVSYNNGGQPCIKDGVFKFLATGKRKYYRLQEMKNCGEENVVDYIDIYF